MVQDAGGMTGWVLVPLSDGTASLSVRRGRYPLGAEGSDWSEAWQGWWWAIRRGCSNHPAFDGLRERRRRGGSGSLASLRSPPGSR